MYVKGTSQAKQKCTCEQYFPLQENTSLEQHSIQVLRCLLQPFCLYEAEKQVEQLKLFARKGCTKEAKSMSITARTKQNGVWVSE